MRRPVPLLALALALAACGPRPSQGAQTPAPAETEPPNAPNQRPAFPGQTRAPALTVESTPLAAPQLLAFRVEAAQPAWYVVARPPWRDAPKTSPPTTR